MNLGLELITESSSLAEIAVANISSTVKTIEAVLAGGLSLSLGFLASAAGLTKIADSIKAALNKIQKPAEQVLKKIADWFKRMFSSLVAKVKPGTKPVTGDKSNSSAKPSTANTKPTPTVVYTF
jgi:predicted ABC-type sugar transport system permease subunit